MTESGHSFGSKPLGYALTLCGGILWAIGGSFGQSIFRSYDLGSDWLVPIRLMLSGALLLLVAFCRDGWQNVTRVWTNRRDARDMILFTVFGAGTSQYTYYTAIQHSNAAFATVISYMFPALILLYGILKNHRLPKLYETLAVILVISGAFICTTHFKPGALSVSGTAIFFGLLCVLASAYNTVKPQRLLKIYPLMAIMGFSMLLSGALFSLFCRPWRFSPTVDAKLILLMAGLIVGGTILAFCFFQAGVRIVGSLAGSILASVEPVGAVLIGVFFLGVAFTGEDFLGFSFILATIPLIAIGQTREERLAKALTEALLSKEDMPLLTEDIPLKH